MLRPFAEVPGYLLTAIVGIGLLLFGHFLRAPVQRTTLVLWTAAIELGWIAFILWQAGMPIAAWGYLKL